MSDITSSEQWDGLTRAEKATAISELEAEISRMCPPFCPYCTDPFYGHPYPHGEAKK